MIKLISISIFIGMLSQAATAELGTLFTTEVERKTIDEQRFTKPVIAVPVKEIKKEPVKIIPKIKYKTVTTDYKISGITTVKDGTDSVWINGQRYDHGDSIEDDIKISVKGSNLGVVLKVKGGKSYNARSGETISISKLVEDIQQK